MVASDVPFTTVARRAEVVEIHRGSRFLAVVAPAPTLAVAVTLLSEVRGRHEDATHHCSAWRLGPDMASSDDGEPAGTAGRPMLGVLLKRDLDRVAAVCVRWYGGTNLGTGGLVRAYAGAVAKALDAAGTVEVHESVACRVRAPFARADAVHRLVDGWRNADKGEARYEAAGTVVAVRIRSEDLPAFERAVADATAGEARVEADGPDGDGRPH